jgi:hypothetical protein
VKKVSKNWPNDENIGIKFAQMGENSVRELDQSGRPDREEEKKAPSRHIFFPARVPESFFVIIKMAKLFMRNK